MSERHMRIVPWRVTRIAMPAGSVLVAAASAIIVNVLTDDWGWAWWVLLGVLVVANVALLVRVGPAAGSSVSASGAGSVAAGGSIHGNMRTTVRGPAAGGSAPTGQGVEATGPGAVAAGGDIVGDTTTNIG